MRPVAGDESKRGDQAAGRPNCRRPGARRQAATAGFTLIEALITLAVLAILLSLAVPGFQDLVRNSRAAAHTNLLVASMAYARSEAVRRGEPVSLCPATGDQSSCANSTDWRQGWIAFSDPDASGTVGDDGILRAWQELPGQVTLTGPQIIRYRATGDIAAPLSFNYRIASGNGVTTRLACVNRVGRTRVDKENDNCGSDF